MKHHNWFQIAAFSYIFPLYHHTCQRWIAGRQQSFPSNGIFQLEHASRKPQTHSAHYHREYQNNIIPWIHLLKYLDLIQCHQNRLLEQLWLKSFCRLLAWSVSGWLDSQNHSLVGLRHWQAAKETRAKDKSIWYWEGWL